jgi:hypothetical protein
VISLTSARNLVALEEVVYRHVQRKISSAKCLFAALHAADCARASLEQMQMFYTTRLLVSLAVTGGLAAAIVLWLFGELIASGINLSV